MNTQQIKYIRECLKIRERQLIEKHGKREEMPHDINCYDIKVAEWRDQSWKKSQAAITAIKNKVRLAEERIVLGGAGEGVMEALLELDSWSPEVDP